LVVDVQFDRTRRRALREGVDKDAAGTDRGGADSGRRPARGKKKELRQSRSSVLTTVGSTKAVEP
jgi:hypothetical protein